MVGVVKDFRGHFNQAGLRFKLGPVRVKRRLCAAQRFDPPKELLLDGYCTPAEDQGARPWCAAYAATSFAESVKWRLNGRYTELDPGPVYRKAKEIDGEEGDGTYLDCALEALVALNVFPKSCKAKMFGNDFFGFGPGSGFDTLKWAIHRYGCCLGAFNITEEWFTPRDAVIRGEPGWSSQGGHAVLICGYDQGGCLVMNSWGRDYGRDGKVYVRRQAFDRQFMCGAVLAGAFRGME